MVNGESLLDILLQRLREATATVFHGRNAVLALELRSLVSM